MAKLNEAAAAAQVFVPLLKESSTSVLKHMQQGEGSEKRAGRGKRRSVNRVAAAHDSWSLILENATLVRQPTEPLQR